MKDTIKLADTIIERHEAVREVQQRMLDFELENRAIQDKATETLAQLQGELHKAEADLRNALLAQKRILDEVPIRFRQAAESAAGDVRAHEADLKRAQRDLQAAQALLDKRQADEHPTLGKEEQKALIEQVGRANVALGKVMTKHEHLVEAQQRAETFVASEVAKIRKASR